MRTSHGYSFSCALLPPTIGDASGSVSPPLSTNCTKGCVLRTLAIGKSMLEFALQLITVIAEIKKDGGYICLRFHRCNGDIYK